jgi:nucleoside-diphosphate-sugar epimerase
MRVLFIGGSGNISSICSKVAAAAGFELILLNRGESTKLRDPEKYQTIRADIGNVEQTAKALKGLDFDAVVDWIAYDQADVERDLGLFRGHAAQYIFISTASAYQRPLSHPVITESTPLRNLYWEYSRKKIACETRLMEAYREEAFPVTIVRPSHTYNTIVPVAVGRSNYTVPRRMLEGKSIVVPGDGSSLWTVTHAEDFAKGLVGLIGSTRAIGHAFHITSDEILTWNQIFETLADALGVKANIVHMPSDFISRFDEDIRGSLLGDKAWSVIFDNTKIKSFVPQFKASIPFSEGIRRTLAWFDEDERRKQIDLKSDKLMDDMVSVFKRIYQEE